MSDAALAAGRALLLDNALTLAHSVNTEMP